jgi:effector-binding domain-containing protein
MRILKYLLLIIILVTFGMAVFVATSKPTYNITKSIFIKSTPSVVYNYLIDYRNWETFDTTLSDKNNKLDFTEITWGKGSWVSWKGNSNGSMQTISCKENDSIQQKIIVNGESSVVTWFLKDTIGGAKITWKTNGKIDFKSKITSFFRGGIEKVLITDFEQKIVNLDKTLNYEMSTYSIKNIGLVSRVGTFYLKQTLNCKNSSVSKNIKIVLPRLKKFFKTNNILSSGKPFIIYSNQAIGSDNVQISVCIPVKDSIFPSLKSNVKLGKLASYTAMKTKLIGNYSHIKKAWQSSMNYLVKNKILVNPAIEISEVYLKTIEETSYPSKWETDIYIPILPKKIIKKRYFKQSVDTLPAPPSAPTTQSLPEVLN